VPIGDRLDGFDIARVAVAMNRDDGGRAGRDRRLDPSRVYVQIAEA
jgi:hypothetical protein